eukprot:1997202-Alexandrium_andersonii.AAC.1
MQEEAGEEGRRSRQASAPAPPSRSVSSVTPRDSSRASSSAGGGATRAAETTRPTAVKSAGRGPRPNVDSRAVWQTLADPDFRRRMLVGLPPTLIDRLEGRLASVTEAEL